MAQALPAGRMHELSGEYASHLWIASRPIANTSAELIGRRLVAEGQSCAQGRLWLKNGQMQPASLHFLSSMAALLTCALYHNRQPAAPARPAAALGWLATSVPYGGRSCASPGCIVSHDWLMGLLHWLLPLARLPWLDSGRCDTVACKGGP